MKNILSLIAILLIASTHCLRLSKTHLQTQSFAPTDVEDISLLLPHSTENDQSVSSDKLSQDSNNEASPSTEGTDTMANTTQQIELEGNNATKNDENTQLIEKKPDFIEENSGQAMISPNDQQQNSQNPQNQSEQGQSENNDNSASGVQNANGVSEIKNQDNQKQQNQTQQSSNETQTKDQDQGLQEEQADLQNNISQVQNQDPKDSQQGQKNENATFQVNESSNTQIETSAEPQKQSVFQKYNLKQTEDISIDPIPITTIIPQAQELSNEKKMEELFEKWESNLIPLQRNTQTANKLIELSKDDTHKKLEDIVHPVPVQPIQLISVKQTESLEQGDEQNQTNQIQTSNQQKQQTDAQKLQQSQFEDKESPSTYPQGLQVNQANNENE